MASIIILKTIFVICAFTVIPSIGAIGDIKCEEFYVRSYEYTRFYDLSLIKDAQPENYYAKLKISLKSDYGDIHVLFAESNDTMITNRAYEFAIGSYENTLCEIRRKDKVYEKRNFDGNRFADHSIATSPREFSLILSISTGGVVQLEDLDANFKFNLTDQLPVIPVKYVSFAGYRNARTKVVFNCVDMIPPEYFLTTTNTPVDRSETSTEATNAASITTTDSTSNVNMVMTSKAVTNASVESTTVVATSLL